MILFKNEKPNSQISILEILKFCKNAVQNQSDFWTYGITTINKKISCQKCTYWQMYTEECTKEGTLEIRLETIAKE